LDGTLIKTAEEYFHKYICTALQKYGIKPTRDLTRRLWFDDNRDDILRRRGIKNPAEFWQFYNGLKDYDERLDHLSLYDEHDPEFVSSLGLLKISRGVVTASPVVDMDIGVKFFEGGNGHRCFEACRSTYNSGVSKAQAILECVSMLGVDRLNTAFIGNGNGDIREAKKAGVISIHIDRGEFPYKGVEPQYKIRGLHELLKLN